MEQFFQQLLNGLAVGGIYALVALGYTMVYGVLKLINFAHGDLFTIGAYLGLTLLVSCNLSGLLGPAAAVLAVFVMVALLVAILGGIGNIPGAMLGGLLLGVIEALAAGYIAIAWKDAIAFLVLILILIIRPTGILGERTADKL